MTNLDHLLNENGIDKELAYCALNLVFLAHQHQALEGSIRQNLKGIDPCTEFANLSNVFTYLDFNEPATILENLLNNEIFMSRGYITQTIENIIYKMGNLNLLFADAYYSDRNYRTDSFYRNELKDKYGFDKTEELYNAIDMAAIRYITDLFYYLEKNNYPKEEIFKWEKIYKQTLH